MGIIAGIIVWFLVAYILRFIVGFEEWGPWIGMFVGVAVWQYIDNKRKQTSETKKEGQNE